MNAKETSFETVSQVKSLCWHKGQLVDFASGDIRYDLAGNATPMRFGYSYRFDASASSHSGSVAAFYEKLGTKGIITDSVDMTREINRSYYCADVYEYPILLIVDDRGQECLIHCPDEYNRLEIEDSRTGERFGGSRDRELSDFFHSRLVISPDKKTLLSVGWVWHPVDAIRIIDLESCFDDARNLDKSRELPEEITYQEVISAHFIDNNTVVIALGDEDAHSIVQLDLRTMKIINTVSVAYKLGTLMPIDAKHVLCLYNHPKLIELDTGKVVGEWPDLLTGQQTSSIIHHIDAVPPIAMDVEARRLAVAIDKEIHILDFGNC